ncbi:hypothetical protein GALL_433260 [mine drainage metagenome]|uniref:Uncharacterized protein n=1 Tax=mine drainage metagenome TaxID=410659 RepID=A0A1J5QC01_9ZZZZ
MHEGFSAQNGIRAAEEGGIPTVLALHDRSVEKQGLASKEIRRFDVAEPLRSLNEGNFGIFKVTESVVKNVAVRNLIRIEDEHELAMGVHQGIVQVARLGVPWLAFPMLSSSYVADTQFVCQVAHRGARPIVKDPGVMWIRNVASCPGGCSHQLWRFVVGGDEDIDSKTRFGWRRCLTCG